MTLLLAAATAMARAERRLERLLSPRLVAVVLGLTVAASCALALAWALLVPLYQGPDEILNLDYSLAILRAGHLLNVRDLPPGISHPYTTYLVDRTGAERMPFHPQVKAPPGYGSRDYFRALDAAAPALTQPPDHAPYLASRYPFGYFALTAAWLGLAALVAGSGPVTLFFAARLLSVAMLGLTLVLSYGVLRELRISRLRSLILVAAIGLFPLTSFVASYSQADDLSWLLVTATWLVALRAARRASGLRLAALGLVLGLLLVTKYQFFLCAALPALAVVVHRRRGHLRSRGRALVAGALVAGPIAALGAVQAWVGYGSPFPLVGSSRENSAFWTDQDLLAAAGGGTARLLSYVGTVSLRAVWDYFGGGPTFRGFWGEFGWSDTPLVIRSAAVSKGIRGLILVLTLALVALVLLRLARSARRAWRLARRERGRGRLAGVLLANPVIGTYLLFVLFMLAFYVYTDDSFYAQGRNWLPVVLAVFLLALVVAPRVLGPRLGPALSALLLAGLLVYSAAGSHYALSTVRERYYGNGRGLVAAALPAREAGGGDLAHGIDYLFPDRVRAGEPLALGGWAGSMSRPHGVLTVYVEIDGRGDIEAVYGDSRDDVVAATGAPTLARAGFDLLVPTDGLAPGVHVLSLKVVLADGTAYYRPPDTRSFTVSGG